MILRCSDFNRSIQKHRANINNGYATQLWFMRDGISNALKFATETCQWGIRRILSPFARWPWTLQPGRAVKIIIPSRENMHGFYDGVAPGSLGSVPSLVSRVLSNGILPIISRDGTFDGGGAKVIYEDAVIKFSWLRAGIWSSGHAVGNRWTTWDDRRSIIGSNIPKHNLTPLSRIK